MQTSRICKNKGLFGKSVVKVTIIPKIPFKLKSKTSNLLNYKSIYNHDNSAQNLNLFSSRENRKQVTPEYCIKGNRGCILTHEGKCAETNWINMKKTRYKNIGYTATKNRGGDCECKLDDDNAQKSRVTIVGQLGLTQDERYVLNCSATVNDEPIATNVTRKHNNLNGLDMKQNTIKFAVNNNNEFINKRIATQGTQVNLIIKNNKIEKRYRDQTIQCNCNETGILLSASEGNVLKECKSPLVVISIYPRENDIEDVNANPIQIIQHQNSPKHTSMGYSGTVSKADLEKQRVENLHSQYKNKQINIRSRSPSPAIKNRNNFFDRTRDVNVMTTNNFTKKHSPQTPKNLNKLVIQSNEAKQITSCDNNKSFKRKSELDRHYGKQNQYNHITREQQNINTERVKKALVSNFLKNIDDVSTNVSKAEFIIPKDRASKITINIDGENENYDVMFEQSKFDTGLTVHKTAKIKHKNNKNTKKNAEDNSIKNFLTLTDDMIRNESSFRQRNSSPKILPTRPSINVRDSLEITHRKGGRDSRVTKGNNKKVKNIINDDTKPGKKLLEPVKHFRGDDCSLLDPNERDREVRELLGTFTKTSNERSYHIYTVAQGKDCCVKKCSKSLMTGCSIANLLSNEHTKNEYNNSFLKAPSKLEFFSSRDENFISRNECSTPQCTYSIFSNKEPYKTQNLILNRNVQVFLQVEQFNKTRPIILTRKQYDKVKKTIRCTISKKLSVEKSKNCIKNCNMVSVGEVKIKPKLHQPVQLEREIQTDKTKIKKLRRKDRKPKNDQTFNLRDSKLKTRNDTTKNNDLLSTDVKKKNLIKNNETRRAVSSIEIHCTSVDYMKHVAVSSCFGENEQKSINSSNKQKNNNSIHTIFKGYKKCVTPNLGTSAYSLESSGTSSIDFMKPSDAGDCKAKKPFLRRLISCFVMRAHASEFKTTAVSLRKHARMTSSVDSYQINTSLGGLEMSSSLYDTSISFYSNHNVLPVNKCKRGFFSSVRGFLTSRRS